MAAAKPRMMELRFTFQTAPDEEGRYHQFFVRLTRRGPKLVTLVDIVTEEGGVIEGLEVGYFESVRAAVEMVKGRVKTEELEEQTE